MEIMITMTILIDGGGNSFAVGDDDDGNHHWGWWSEQNSWIIIRVFVYDGIIDGILFHSKEICDDDL